MSEPTPDVAIVDSMNHPASFQVLSNDRATHRLHFLLLANAPALGYATYFVQAAAKSVQQPSALKLLPRSLKMNLFASRLTHTLAVSPACMTNAVSRRRSQSQKATLAARRIHLARICCRHSLTNRKNTTPGISTRSIPAPKSASVARPASRRCRSISERST